jgi:Mrp family chromosome partitioning ATPase/capsular polysaccharide biosynthesis protein
LNLVRYLRVLRRRWRVIAAVAALGAVAGLLLAPRPSSGVSQGEAVFLAKHVLWSSTGPETNANKVNLNRIAELVTTGPVPERVARKLGGSPTSLARDVIARPDDATGSINIWARGANPTRTAELADAFALETIRYEQERETADIDARLQRLEDEQIQRELEYVGTPASDTVQLDGLTRRITAIQAEIASLQNAKATMATLDSVQPAEAFQATKKQVETVFTKAPTTGNQRRQQAPDIDPLGGAVSSDDGFALHPVLGALLGAGLGGGLGIMLVLAINALDPRLYTKDDAEAALGFNVIAEIPAFSRKLRRETFIVCREAPYSRFADAYRVLRSSILFVERQPQASGAPGNGNGNGHHVDDDTASTDHGKATVIMITSPGPSEGKTTTVSNLATVLAEDGRRVLVVNCDFRRPRLHTFLGGGEEPRKVFDTQVEGVKLVTGVVANPERVAPAEVIAAQRRLIENAHEHFDYVLLDTAPILTTNDASELLPVTDMVVMICRSGKTTRESADRAAELLERFEAPVIGAALVGATDSPASQYYYYYSSSSQARSEDESEDNPLADLAGGATTTEGSSRAGNDEAGESANDESAPAEVAPSADDPRA